MHFTREPTIETVITPREGHKLVVRSSRGSGTEEYFVDALEVVVFGASCFFRSLERPKSFLLPVSDYEVLEVRETRTVLKAVSVQKEKPGKSESAATEKQLEKKRERRRQRRRKGSDEEEGSTEESKPEEEPQSEEEPPPKKAPRKRAPKKKEAEPEAPEQLPEPKAEPPKSFDTLIPPPAMLISERMEKFEESEPVAAPVVDKETPELVPPVEEKGEGFSPSRLFRRFRGSEESPSSDEEK